MAPFYIMSPILLHDLNGINYDFKVKLKYLVFSEKTTHNVLNFFDGWILEGEISPKFVRLKNWPWTSPMPEKTVLLQKKSSKVENKDKIPKTMLKILGEIREKFYSIEHKDVCFPSPPRTWAFHPVSTVDEPSIKC